MFENYKDKYINGQSAARSLGNIVKYEMTIVQRLSNGNDTLIIEPSRVAHTNHMGEAQSI